jgi:glycosyltransferase involved in cell wall biosynthesis
VALGEPHKNHAALIEAWSVLADYGVFTSLEPESAPDLFALIEKATARGLRIQNLGVLPHDSFLAMFRASGALIYPSSFESIGLPLVEARKAGLPILASELDYVRDVSDPDETFDPHSPISIARAVRRHLDGRTQALEPSCAEALLSRVLARNTS